jgi:hypothetical protein
VFDVHMPRLKSSEATLDEQDHIDWVAGISFLSYGVRVGVRTNDAQVIEKLLPHLPPGWKITRTAVDRLYSLFVRKSINRRAQRLHELYIDGEKLIAVATLHNLLDVFESDVQLYVAEYAPRRVFVHAGVVGWKGKAIVIPGRSYSGKTTLVASLVKAGATYYSDEYAVLDERGRVYAYPRKLSVREGVGGQSTKYAVEELGGKCGSKPLPVGLVVVSNYQEGARFRPREISAGESVLALLTNTVPARRKPQIVLPTLKNAVAQARSIKSRRGESTEVAEAILRGW